MRRILLLGAAAVVLVANGWGVWQAARNRSEARGGTFQLTDREVPLQAVPFESSVTMLRLRWRTDESEAGRRRPPAWLDANKMTELGFDCSVPVSSPEARRHYDAGPSRRVFLAMEYKPDPSDKIEKPGRANTGLVVVDAAQDPRQLRNRYPDPQKHIICRGLVMVRLRRHDPNGALLSTPQLEPWIEGPCPSELSVPKPANRPLLTLRRAVTGEKDRLVGEARFTARVRWGSNYEPWVDDIRPVTVR